MPVKRFVAVRRVVSSGAGALCRGVIRPSASRVSETAPKKAVAV